MSTSGVGEVELPLPCEKPTLNVGEITSDVEPKPSVTVITRDKHDSASAKSSEFSRDVGNYIGQPIDNFTKKALLENPWIPPADYKFPFSTRTLAGRETKNFVSRKHLEAYKGWLVLSHAKKGLFCKYCPWFVTRHEGGYQKNVPLGALVRLPLTNFKKLTEDLESHSGNKYHKDAVEAGKEFLKNYYAPQLEVINQVDKAHFQEAEENRRKLIPIVKTVMFCGRQNIALRGHRDDGLLLLQKSDNCRKNEGNFRELLRFRIDAGDKILENHLKNATARRAYISKTVQNDVINCCRMEILDKILNKVSAAKFYSIMFDESTDLSGRSQLSIILRYVDLCSKNNQLCIREDFVTFIDAFGELRSKQNLRSTEENWDDSDCSESGNESEGNKEESGELSLTGIAIGELILKEMKEMKLVLENCVGLGTDGCSVMTGDNSGAVKKIQTEAVNALMTPCFSHKLNNSISQSSTVPVIKKVVGVITEVTYFFQAKKPKRHATLLQFLGKKLVKLCETRWIERHDAVLQFITDLPEIIEVLEKVSEWKLRETASKASCLIAALSAPDFLVGLFCLGDILALTQPLSVLLQNKTLDLVKASELIKSLTMALDIRREEVSDHFHEIFNEAKEMAEKTGLEIRKPRTCRRQTLRENHAIEDCENYYRVSVYIPLLDSVLTDLKSRFSNEVLEAFQLVSLLPEGIIHLNQTQLSQYADCLLKSFERFLTANNMNNNKALLKGELTHWQQKWILQKNKHLDLPDTAIDVMEKCDTTIYPRIYAFLQILATLPVTNASAERSFSSLRRLETWCRTTMLQSRLVGLALLHIHYDMDVKPENIIERYAKSANRKMVL